MIGQDIIDYIKNNKLENIGIIAMRIKADVKLSNGTMEYERIKYKNSGNSNLIFASFVDNYDGVERKLSLTEDEALYMRDHNEISHKLLYQFNDEKKKK